MDGASHHQHRVVTSIDKHELNSLNTGIEETIATTSETAPLSLPTSYVTSTQQCSKSQLKKIQRKRRKADLKRQRKVRERDERKAMAIQQGRDWEAEQCFQTVRTMAGDSRWRQKRQIAWEMDKIPLAKASFQICLDCAYERYMTNKEIASLASQLRYCYAINKASPHPCFWTATSLGGQTLDEIKKDKGYTQWYLRNFTGTEKALEEYYFGTLNLPKEKLVYLTSDSEHILTELDNDKIYIIGGIVDRNRLKFATYHRACQLGVATAKLPLNEYLQFMPSTRVLTCNHVFEILLQYGQQGNDWGRAMQKVLPKRKAAQLKANVMTERIISERERPSIIENKFTTNHTPSSIPTQSHFVVEDDWGLQMDFHLFAQHQAYPIYLEKDTCFQILCVEALTPLDMMNLGSGEHDSTGNCVWTGAFLLIASLPILRDKYFAHRNVLELGCGTGIGGLSLFVAKNHDDHTTAAFVAMTDSDPDILKLCQRNCDLNELSSDRCVVLPLTWGMEPYPETIRSIAIHTVLATDVLYDLDLLSPLLKTVSACLSTNINGKAGMFILAHVPRACYNTRTPPVNNLDQYIVQQAKQYGLSLERLVRPSECIPDFHPETFPPDALNDMSLKEMEEIGAVIFVFAFRQDFNND